MSIITTRRPIRPVRVPDAAELRAWARKKGLTKSTHGRLGAEIEIAYVEDKLKRGRYS